MQLADSCSGLESQNSRGYYVSKYDLQDQISYLFDNSQFQKKINCLDFGEIVFRIRKGTIYNVLISSSIMTDGFLKEKEVSK